MGALDPREYDGASPVPNATSYRFRRKRPRVHIENVDCVRNNQECLRGQRHGRNCVQAGYMQPQSGSPTDGPQEPQTGATKALINTEKTEETNIESWEGLHQILARQVNQGPFLTIPAPMTGTRLTRKNPAKHRALRGFWEWAVENSNLRPPRCQRGALTN